MSHLFLGSRNESRVVSAVPMTVLPDSSGEIHVLLEIKFSHPRKTPRSSPTFISLRIVRSWAQILKLHFLIQQENFGVAPPLPIVQGSHSATALAPTSSEEFESLRAQLLVYFSSVLTDFRVVQNLNAFFDPLVDLTKFLSPLHLRTTGYKCTDPKKIRNYVMLLTDGLIIYLHRKKQSSRGCIPLCWSTTVTPQILTTSDSELEPYQEFGLEITTPDRTHRLCFQSATDREAWVTELKLVIQRQSFDTQRCYASLQSSLQNILGVEESDPIIPRRPTVHDLNTWLSNFGLMELHTNTNDRRQRRNTSGQVPAAQVQNPAHCDSLFVETSVEIATEATNAAFHSGYLTVLNIPTTSLLDSSSQSSKFTRQQIFRRSAVIVGSASPLTYNTFAELSDDGTLKLFWAASDRIPICSLSVIGAHCASTSSAVAFCLTTQEQLNYEFQADDQEAAAQWIHFLNLVAKKAVPLAEASWIQRSPKTGGKNTKRFFGDQRHTKLSSSSCDELVPAPQVSASSAPHSLRNSHSLPLESLTAQLSLENATAQVSLENATAQLSLENATTQLPLGNATAQVSLENATTQLPLDNATAQLPPTVSSSTATTSVEELPIIISDPIILSEPDIAPGTTARPPRVTSQTITVISDSDESSDSLEISSPPPLAASSSSAETIIGGGQGMGLPEFHGLSTDSHRIFAPSAQKSGVESPSQRGSAGIPKKTKLMIRTLSTKSVTKARNLALKETTLRKNALLRSSKEGYSIASVSELISGLWTEDEEFVRIILFTHPTFVASGALWSLIETQFKRVRPSKPNASAGDFLQLVLHNRVRIIGILHVMIEMGVVPAEFQDQIVEFIEHFGPVTISLLPAITNELLEWAKTTKIRRNLPPLPQGISISPDFLSNMTVEQIAQCLSVVEHRAFAAIQPIEYLVYIDDKTKATTIASYINHFNLLSRWLASEILRQSSKNDSLNMLTKLVHVADYCRSIGNFATLLIISSAIYSPQIFSQRSALLHLPRETKLLIRSLSDLMSPSKNYKKYTAALKQVKKPPGVPYMGLILRQLVTIDECQPDIIDFKINFSKRVHFYQALNDCIRFRSTPYSFTSTICESFPQVLRILESPPEFSEQDLDILYACGPYSETTEDWTV